MNPNKIILTLFIILSGMVTGYGQYSYKQHIKYADISYENSNYIEAIKHYKKAFELAEYLDETHQYQYANAAFNVYSLNIAAEQFSKYLELDTPPMAHDAAYKLAKIYHLRGEYQNAITYYNLFLSEYEEVDTVLSYQALFDIASASWVLSAEVESPVDSVSRLGNDVNSPFSDHAPYKLKDELYYSSFKFPIPDDKLKRYNAKILTNQQAIELLPESPDQFPSNCSFTEDGQMIFFTLCRYTSNVDINCEIYFSIVNPDTTFSKPKKLPEVINSSGATTTHPNICMIDSVKTLFFSSDRSGTLGKRDIWMSTFDDRMVFTDPINIKVANSEGDDITPFYHEPSNNLYLSSNGRYGYGGYDLFKLEDPLGQEGNMSNLGNKVNTPNDDINFFMTENGSEFYFSSNRPGSLFLESEYETCCFDIYSAKIKECKIDLLALIYNAVDKSELNGVNIKVLDVAYNDIVYNETIDSSQTNIELECDKEYEVTASKDGFEDLTISLVDLKPVYGQINKVTRKFYMQPSIIDLKVLVYDFENKDLPLPGVELTIQDVDTGEQEIQTNEDSNDFYFQIKPNHNYIITGKKNAYDDNSLSFNAGSFGGSQEKILYLEKTEIIKKTEVSLMNAIPVRLYFDNDEPDRGKTTEYSTQNYSETYYKYYNKREKFKQVYGNQMPPAKRDAAIAEIDALFQNNIKAGFDKYENFKNQLLIVLEAGLPVNIYLRGYASPLSKSEYNTALGRRRVDSIRKEFDEWKGGIFIPYINSGQLVITERSFGEDTAPPDVSDDPRNPGSSIYSPGASIERRVEIDEINFNEN